MNAKLFREISLYFSVSMNIYSENEFPILRKQHVASKQSITASNPVKINIMCQMASQMMNNDDK